MNKKEIKEMFEQLLQYGWMWGWPKFVGSEGWDKIRRYYKLELNNGKEFEPDENNKATAHQL